MRIFNPGRTRWRALAWATSLAVLAATPAGARADDNPAVIIVFDGSGSMAGIIEGTRTSKVNLAREAVRRGLAAVPPQTRVGLVSFGNRRGDCADVDVVRRPDPLEAARITEGVDSVNPRGRGPLTHALREAARQFAPGPGRRSVVLIHDEYDNCQQNVCVAAEELRRAGIVAHSVGLGLKPDDAQRMLCLPQLTGGRSYNARTPGEIAAAVEEALRIASADAARGVPRPVAATPPAGQLAAALAVPANAPPGLYLRAVLAPGTVPVALPVQWTVRSAGQPGTTLFSGRVASPHVPAPPGRYVIEAREGTVAVSQTVQLTDTKPTEVRLVLNAGTLHVRAQAQRVGAPLGDAIITVSGQAGEGRKDAASPVAVFPVAVFKGGEALAVLLPGRYVVRAEQGLVRGEGTAVVQAGSQASVDIALNAARILLTASGQDAAAGAEALTFSVDEDDPDAPRGRREVARSAARQADFVLPPGTYYIVARQGGVETREILAVGPGDVIRRTLALAAGRLALAIKPAGAGQAPSEPVSYRVERLDGALPEPFTTSRPAPVLLLPAGRYRVEGRYGAMNARVQREVDVKAGQVQQLTLEPLAATLKLRLAAQGTPLLADVFWDIRDEAGVTVWTSGLSEPSAVLRAGRYSVRAETRDKRYDRAIELRPGESRLVEVVAD